MLINCDATRSNGNKAHGVLMAAAFCQIYANTSHSTNAPPLIVYLFVFLQVSCLFSRDAIRKKRHSKVLSMAIKRREAFFIRIPGSNKDILTPGNCPLRTNS